MEERRIDYTQHPRPYSASGWLRFNEAELKGDAPEENQIGKQTAE